MFTTAIPHEIDRLRVVITETAKNEKDTIILATEFAKLMVCTSTNDFIYYIVIFVAEFNETARNYEKLY